MEEPRNCMYMTVGRTPIRSRSTVCFSVKNRYLLVKRNDDITYFLENYLNYGFNKISFVETLRNHGTNLSRLITAGYHFYAAGKVFAFDVPHFP